MSRLLFFVLLLTFFIGLDVYAYHGLASLVSQGKFTKIYKVIYYSISIFTYISLISVLFFMPSGLNGVRSELQNFMIGFLFTIVFSKGLFCALLLLQDGGRFVIGFGYGIKKWFSSSPESIFIPERRQFITSIGTMAAAVPFFSMLYGITKGKYKYTVEKVVLSFKNLPKTFDGFRVVQISDIHAGSFDNLDKVMLGVEKLNALNPDIVCFTGDLVNAEKDEIDPYIEVFSTIKSRYGKYAVLGNHDYYGSWDKNDPVAGKTYFDDFFQKFEKMGFSLLNNENKKVSIGAENINMVGVENWGAGRWFPKRGDLDQATVGIQDGQFSILMSHDPTHWDEVVSSHATHIDLTLSGHTHGFQLGFQMPGFKWSPAQYRYKRWMGLYEVMDKFLYVNRGFGFLGFPGRVGMWPEITLIELKCAV